MIVQFTNAGDGNPLFIAADTIGMVCPPDNDVKAELKYAQATVWLKGEQSPYVVQEDPITVVERWSSALGCIIVAAPAITREAKARGDLQ